MAKGKIIQLLRIEEGGKITILLTQQVFGLVRKLIAFRLLGMQKDFLVVGSDSGRIVILEYDDSKKMFVKII